MFNKFVMCFAVIVAVAISGCIGQQQITGDNGVTIKGLYTDPQQDLIEVGDKLDIYYELQNIGGTVATNVMTTVYGITWIPETERLEKYCEPIPNCQRGLTLYPPDPITKSPGGTKTIHFQILIDKDKVPLPSGLKKTFPLKLRTSFDYKTGATTVLQGYSKKRYITELQLGNQQTVIGDVSTPVQTVITGTPISVSISGPDKIVVNDATQNEPDRTIRYTYDITFTNAGSGYPIQPLENFGEGTEQGIIATKLRIEGPGTTLYDCLDQNIQGNELNTVVKLRGGSVTKSCTIEIKNNYNDENSWFNREFNTINMYFDLSYRYFAEKDFSISITKPIEYA